MSVTTHISSDITVEITKAESSNTTCSIKNNELNDNSLANMDAPALASLLECLGFKLQNFEKCDDEENQSSSLTDFVEGYLQVDITCSKSNMKATLLKKKSGCKCPSKEDTSNAQFWNISACSPALPGNVTMSKSSLIQTVPADKSKLVNALLLKALDIINSNEKNVWCKSLENLKTESHAVPNSMSNVQNIESYSTSPRKTSSPIVDFKQDYEKMSNLIETLKEAQKLLGDAVMLAGNQNTTFTKRVRRLSDLKISPLGTDEPQPSNASTLSASKTDNSCCKTPRKPKTPKRVIINTAEKKKFLAPPSRLGILRRNSDSVLPTTSKLSVGRKDTSRPVDKSLKLNVSSVKQKGPIKNEPTASKLRTPAKFGASTNAKVAKK